MNPSQIVQFLRANPSFFDDYASLLGDLTVTHPQNGQAISLVERQVLALRERIAQLENKFAELLEFGEENDAISEKIHRLTLSLLEANQFEAVRNAVFTHLQEDFKVPHVAFRVWNSVLSRNGAEFLPVDEEIRFFTGDLAAPYCGAPAHREVLNWFGPAGRQVKSISLVPLRHNEKTFGLLALGSEDSQRFYAAMGTLYVSRIGEMVSAALVRQLG